MVTRRRGFSLLELLVAMGVATVVMTGALAVFLAGSRTHRRQLEVSQLRRTAQAIHVQLASELRQLGLGVPERFRAEGGNDGFPYPLVAADVNQLVFLADLPRPDGALNGLSLLVDEQSANMPATPAVAIVNELSGPCEPSLVLPPHCNTDQQSSLFPAGTSCSTNGAAPSCPWSLNKYRGGEPVIVVDGSGRWVERTVAAGLFADSAARRALALTAAVPAGFYSAPAAGFVSTPDRIFWRLNGAQVERNQCWGSVGAPVAGLAAPCAAGPTGTGWEPLATNAAAPGLSFTYLDAAGAALATPVPAADLRRIRRVRISLHLERQTVAGLVSHDSQTEVAVRQ